MKITLQKSELEKFISLSSFCNITKESTIYTPISEYILLEIKKGFCKLTLSSNETFVTNTFSTNQPDARILLSYFQLQDYLKNKRGDSIIISETEKRMSISDGVFTDFKSKDESILIENYPSQPLLHGLTFKRINKDVLDVIEISKGFIKSESKDKLIPFLNNSNILGNKVLSSDSFISFYYTLQEQFDFTFFSKQEIELISQFDFIDYILLNNWNIIKYKTVSFGKRLQEGIVPLLYPQMESYVSFLDKTRTMKIPIDQLKVFCKSIINSAKDKTVNSDLRVVKDGIELMYVDIKNDKESHQFIKCEVIGFEEGFHFLLMQEAIIKVLESIDAEVINLSECVEPSGKKGYIGFWLDLNPNFYSICSKGIEL